MIFAGLQTYATVLFLLICFFCLKDSFPYGDMLVKSLLQVPAVAEKIPAFPSPCGDVLVK